MADDTIDYSAPGQIDRSAIAAELEQKPWLRDRLAQMVRGEVGPSASDEVRRIQMESAMNRALARGHSLEQALWDTGQRGKQGYYPPMTFARGSHDPEVFDRDLQTVLAGSNYGGKYNQGIVTGNASGDIAARQFEKKTPGFTLQTGVGPESYFSEGPFRVALAVNAPSVAQPAAGAQPMGNAPAVAPAIAPAPGAAVASTAAPPAASAAPSPFDGLITMLRGAGAASDANKGTGTLADLGKQLMAAGTPQPKLPSLPTPLDTGPMRRLPLNLPKFAAAAPGIPQFAEGGVVTEPTLAMIGERGPEAVVPLQGMTHYPPAPNPAQPAVDFGKQFATSLYNKFVGNPLAAAKSVTQQAMAGERVSDDPEGIRNAWRAVAGLAITGNMPGGLFAAPRGAQLNAVLGPLAYEGSMFHKLIDKTTKKEVGYANLSMTPDKDIYVNMVDSPGGAGSLGFEGSREMLKSVKEHYPEARGIGGFRVSGAREQAGHVGDVYYSYANRRFERPPWARASQEEENLLHALESLRGTQWEQGVRDELAALRGRQAAPTPQLTVDRGPSPEQWGRLEDELVGLLGHRPAAAAHASRDAEFAAMDAALRDMGRSYPR